jgi:hypothetical protein
MYFPKHETLFFIKSFKTSRVHVSNMNVFCLQTKCKSKNSDVGNMCFGHPWYIPSREPRQSCSCTLKWTARHTHSYTQASFHVCVCCVDKNDNLLFRLHVKRCNDEGEEASLYSSKRYQNRPIRRSNLRRTVIAFHQYKGSTLASHLKVWVWVAQ